MDRDNVTGLAAQVSYYFALALFPFLILVGAVVGTLPFTHAWQSILTWITQSLPGDTRDIVFATLGNLTQGHRSLLSAGLLGTTWAASGGLMSLASALNAVYHIPESRRYWHRLGLCVVLLFALAVLVLVSFVLLTAGDRIDRWLSVYGPADSPMLLLIPLIRWMLSVALIVLGINLVDYLLPNMRRPWRWIRPGMGVMVGGWLLASLGFNWYVRHVASYNRTYGVLGGFVVLMVWMYIGILIALSGAAVDAELQELRKASPESLQADAPGTTLRAS